jgi:hypothetical protein
MLTQLQWGEALISIANLASMLQLRFCSVWTLLPVPLWTRVTALLFSPDCEALLLEELVVSLLLSTFHVSSPV